MPSCKNCGKDIRSNDDFCPHCGYPTARWNRNRIGTVTAGTIFIFLGILIIIPLPLDGSWIWGPEFLGESAWLGILSGIFSLILGLWVVIDVLRSPSPPPPKSGPIVDEWILEERGWKEEAEAAEISHCKKYLDPNEKLLMIIAARVKSGLNRLALTDRRIIFHPQGKIQDGISFGYGQIDDVQRKQRRFLTHLADLTFSVRGRIIRFEKVGTEWADEIVNTISRMKQKE